MRSMVGPRQLGSGNRAGRPRGYGPCRPPLLRPATGHRPCRRRRPLPGLRGRRHDDAVTTAASRSSASTTCPAGEVLIKVAWSSVNYKDGMVTCRATGCTRLSPLVPGVDLAGVVVASDDPALAVGTEVLAHGGDLGVARHGGYAALRAGAGAGTAVALPAGLSARQAMAIGTAGFTAALSLDQLEQRGLAPGRARARDRRLGWGRVLRRRPVGPARLRGRGEHRQGRRAPLARAPRRGPRHRARRPRRGGRARARPRALGRRGGLRRRATPWPAILQSCATAAPSPPAGSPGAPTLQTHRATPSSPAAWRCSAWTRSDPARASARGVGSPRHRPPSRASRRPVAGEVSLDEVGDALADILAVPGAGPAARAGRRRLTSSATPAA